MFTYALPPALIAQTPAEPRDSARLLTWPARTEHPFAQLPNLLQPNDLLILNSSQVIPARLFATRPARKPAGQGAAIELLLHRPLNPTLTAWQVFARPAKRLRGGDVLHFPDGKTTAEITPLGPPASPARAASAPQWQLQFNNTLTTQQISGLIHAHGHTPLPPYIKTEDSQYIKQRYQTVYANPATPGSVAAPTAGLHFTPAVFQALEAKGIKTAHVTLHVGAGTFQNPTPQQIASGKLHAEWAELSPATAALIKQTKALGGHVIAVGTTACRTLETWGQLGQPGSGFSGDTDIFIQPGFTFKVVDKLLTNFHLPGSSLLMLVAAFIGETEIADLYAHAIKNAFRFYSFGDTSLLTRKDLT